MKGVNTLSINQATAIEAMQLWINSQMQNPPIVIKFESKTGSYQNNEFELTIEAKEEVQS